MASFWQKKLFWTITILLFNFIQTVVVCKHKRKQKLLSILLEWPCNFSLSVPWIYRVVEVDLTRDAVRGFLKHFRAIQAKLNNLIVPEGYKMSIHILHYKLRACKSFFGCSFGTFWFRNNELGRVVRKLVNVNPGLNVNWSIVFLFEKVFRLKYFV